MPLPGIETHITKKEGWAYKEGLHDQDKNGTSPLGGCVEGGPEARDRGSCRAKTPALNFHCPSQAGSFQTLSISRFHRAVAHLK